MTDSMRKPSFGPTGQGGVALVTAILIVALATILATELMWQRHLHLRRAESNLGHEQARQYALGAETLAASVLMSDASDGQVDHLQESWADAIVPLPIEGGRLYGGIEDLQSRVNLNNLWRNGPDGQTDAFTFAQFQKLLNSLDLDPDLAEAVLDWLDPDQTANGASGAEDDRYTGLDPPYRAGNGYMTSASELLAIQGFDLDTYRALAPYVTALLPGWCNTNDLTAINVNTAPGPVLLSLSPALTESDVEGLLEQRKSLKGWTNLSSFEQHVDADVLQSGYMDIQSQCFQAAVTVELGSSRLTMYSLLDRTPEGDQIVSRSRSFGVN